MRTSNQRRRLRRKKTKRGFLLQNGIAVLGFFLICLLFGSRWSQAMLSEALPFYMGEETEHIPPSALPQAAQTVLKTGDITYQAPPTKPTADALEDNINLTDDFDFLKKNYFIIDSRTSLLPTDVILPDFFQKSFALQKKAAGPQILILHTHSTEGYLDSDMQKDMSEGIWGVGETLKNILEKDYGYRVLHDTGRYDIVNGQGQILGAYERMEPPIRKILAENPSIEVIIDMHRDGLPEDVHLVTDIEGRPTAQLMFVNGLCRLQKDGNLQELAGLANPYRSDNLAFSLQLKAATDQLYPGLMRRIYINAYRYSLHMQPRSLLLEVGSQMNSKEEAKNAMIPFAKSLHTVLSRGQ